jgi:hypothetical protein
MDEQYYPTPPGGASLRGAGYTPWFTRQAWNPAPNLESQDPHDGPLEVEVGTGPPAVGPSAENVVGGDIGSVAADFDGGYDHGPTPGNIFTD